MLDPIIGIDLGTSNSAVAVVQDGKPHVIADSGDRKIQPSVVSFHPDGSVIVGAAAKQRRIIDPPNTIYSAKRLIGRTFDSREVREAAIRVPYTIKQGVNRQPVVVTRAGEFAIPELAAILLDHLRGLAQAALDTEITRAVVTVPANFTDAQRTATITAGDIAGIEVVQVLNEPTAAALACGSQRKLNRRVAVYDFGGGTFDITILDVRGSVYEVLSTAGDPFLGGDDMDERLVDTMVGLFFEQEGVDLRGDEQSMQRLRTVAEQVKIELSRRDRARITIDALARGPTQAPVDFTMRVTREDLEAHANELVDRSFAVSREALRMAGLAPRDIQEVILIGGTTKMPLVRNRVSELFGRAPRTDIHPDEAVAMGAAIHGNTLRQSLGRDPRQARRKHTAPGMVAPPAPPMEARAPVKRGQQSGWERGGTMPWVEFGEDHGIPGLDRPVAMDTLDIPTTAQGEILAPGDALGVSDFLPGTSRDVSTNVETNVETNVARDSSRALLASDYDEVSTNVETNVETNVARDSSRALLASDYDEVSTNVETNVETNVARDSSRALLGTPAARGSSQQAPAPPPGFGDSLFSLPDASMPRTGPVTGALSLADFDADPNDPRGAGLAAGPAPGLAPEPEAGAGGAQDPAQDPAQDSVDPWSSILQGPIILEVAPLSLGMGTVAGFCRQLIARNSRVPVETREVFTTSRDLQRTVRIRVCQGESRRLDENQVLGDLVLDGIEPRPRGQTQIEVVFRIDESGILHVRARDLNTGREQRAELQIAGAPSFEEVTAAGQRLRRLRR